VRARVYYASSSVDTAPTRTMSSYFINACMRQSPTPDARKQFTSAAVVTSHHAAPGNDVIYRSDAYYNAPPLYPTSRTPAAVTGFGGVMHDKLMGGGNNGGGGGGSVFQHSSGFGDPGSPMGYPSGGGGGGSLQYKPAPSLHNGLHPHHDATGGSALTHRPPSAASVSPSAAGATAAAAAALVDEKSPAALSPPLSSSPGSSSPPPAAESEQTASGGAAAGNGDGTTATSGDDTAASQQQQQQSPTEPLIYPWMRRVHSGHGGKTNANHLIIIIVD